MATPGPGADLRCTPAPGPGVVTGGRVDGYRNQRDGAGYVRRSTRTRWVWCAASKGLERRIADIGGSRVVGPDRRRSADGPRGSRRARVSGHAQGRRAARTTASRGEGPQSPVCLPVLVAPPATPDVDEMVLLGARSCQGRVEAEGRSSSPRPAGIDSRYFDELSSSHSFDRRRPGS
jgi:hypothetical protein